MSVPSHHRGSLRARLPTLASLQALVLALLGGMAVALATSAAAHDTIIDAEPAHDAVLDTAPTEIVLTYSADILDLPAAILVTDSNSGEVIVEGEPTIQGQSVVLDLPALENGTYEVLWSVISSDGHRTEDTYNFTVAASEPENDPQATTPAEASSQAPTTQATPESTTQTPIASPAVVNADAGSPASGWPIGVVILLPIAVLGLALTAAVIYRRRRQNQVAHVWRTRAQMEAMDYVVALLPSIGVGTLVVVVMRAILLADRRERAATRKFEEAEDSRVAAQRDRADTGRQRRALKRTLASREPCPPPPTSLRH